MAVDALARAIAAGKVPVTAYEMAVKAGYTGTEEQFAEDMGNSGTNAANAAASASAAAASAESISASAAQIATNTGDISDLKTQLSDVISYETDGQIINFTNGAYIATNVSVGNVVNLTPVSNNNWCYAISPCNPGDVILINGKGSATARIWAFLDSDNKMVKTTNATGELVNVKITAPAGSAKVVLNTLPANKGLCINGNSLNAKVAQNEKTLNDILDTINPKVLIPEAYIKNNDPVGTQIELTPVTNANYSYAVFKVNEGDTVTITGNGGGTARLWAFLNANDEIISQAEINATNADVIAPQNAAKVVVNVITSTFGGCYINFSEELTGSRALHRMVAGVIRNDGTGWNFIVNSRHQGDLNCTSVSVNEDGNIVVNYPNIQAKKVVSLVITPDETFSALGYLVGASVGLDLCIIKVSHYVMNSVGGRISVANDGTITVSSDAVGIDSCTWDSENSRMVVNHNSMNTLTAMPSIMPGLYGRYIPRIYSVGQTSTTIEFWDPATSAKVTTLDSKLTIWFSRIDVRGLQVKQIKANDIVNENGNFWFMGIFEV